MWLAVFNPKIKPGTYQLDFSLIKVIASVCGLILISNIYPREEVKRESVSLALQHCSPSGPLHQVLA
jgi:hypothetical protein